jgi:DNA-binding MarR family transcriptional regulator
MGKGLSPLQNDILAVLDEWPSFEMVGGSGYLGDWALPRDIIRRLCLPRNGATRASMSRALLRLHERGLVARASGECAMVGKSFRYVIITNSANAGAGNSGPSFMLSRRKHKPMKDVTPRPTAH